MFELDVSGRERKGIYQRALHNWERMWEWNSYAMSIYTHLNTDDDRDVGCQSHQSKG